MRHKKVEKRIAEPDRLYRSVLVARTINRMMRDGKKTIAQNLMYKALDNLKEKGKDPLQTFEKALQNISPRQEIKARRVGGANYQVPIEVRGDRKVSLSIRWLVQAADARPNKEFHTFDQKLAAEILDAADNKGEAIRKRDVMHKQAEANKAFAHFRW
jgi:small subunit ribosomal protein S7